ncbi:hypothetical protein VNO77_17847 [Canavalia gladiata]|uniref:Uncharacterized protein n=1 Tax=Canavalia gladiata TaxID=3824 RepID=A0AAN9LNI8_CANGL
MGKGEIPVELNVVVVNLNFVPSYACSFFFGIEFLAVRKKQLLILFKCLLSAQSRGTLRAGAVGGYRDLGTFYRCVDIVVLVTHGDIAFALSHRINLISSSTKTGKLLGNITGVFSSTPK